MQCSIDGCPQLVLNTTEQKKKCPLCFYHAKVRDGLIDPEDTLSTTDKNWKNRDATASKYKGYPYKIAHKYAKIYGTQHLQDFISVGMVALFEASDADTVSSSYIYKYITGAIKDYIYEDKRSGIKGVSKQSFWNIVMGRHYIKRQKNLDDQEFMSHTVDSLDRRLNKTRVFHDFIPSEMEDPEQILLRKENEKTAKIMSVEVGEFYLTLNTKERIVFQRLMLAKEPLSARKLAEKMGYKNHVSVTNLQRIIIEKAKEYFQ